ncbi:MAG TPA: GMC family oxidoreductase [Longimicrobium sp.]|nr:GMC family oxidoreductase [Longimicrobium sp.]
MIIDGNEFFKTHPCYDAHVCILGGGAAGITLALELARKAPGLNVVVLEGGEDPPPIKGDQSASQPLYAGEMVGDMAAIRPDFLTKSRFRAFGGSTNCWGAWCRPLDQMDIAGHGDYPAWPLPAGELERFYPRAQTMCSLGPFEYDPGYWVDRSRGTLATIPGSPAVVRQTCVLGVQDGKKCFFKNYRAELEAAPNLRFILHSNLVRIHADGTSGMDSITHVSGKTLHPGTLTVNRDFDVYAKVFVVALGGIETVRALLDSPSERQRDGLGNNHDKVGRFFNVHPVVGNAATVTFDPGVRWSPPVRNFLALTRFPISPAAAEAPGPLETGVEVPDYDADADGTCPNANPNDPPYEWVWSVLVPTAETLRNNSFGNFRVMLNATDAGCTFNVCWEQLPSDDSRLTLADSVDVLGNRRVRVEWKLSEADMHTYERAVDAASYRLSLAYKFKFQRNFNIRDRASWWTRLVPGDHPMGGTRMSVSATDGVVNPDCRLHAVDNLYVSSSSNWPSGGWANPTLSIVAMALRLADHLLGQVAEEVAVRIDNVEIAAPLAAPGAD